MVPQQHTIPTPYPVGPVHCYSMESNGQLILIDTGPPTATAKSYLQQHFNLTKLQHVLITHCHIDHYGLAAWLERDHDCTIYIPFRDSLKISRHNERLDGVCKLLEELGCSLEFVREFRHETDSEAIFPEFPKNYKIVEQDLPEELEIQAIPCPGHSQSDMVYIGDNWAITGDTLLRDIFQSPMLDIDLLTGERFNNYQAYCKTIIKLAGLGDKQILPGHNLNVPSAELCLLEYVNKLLDRASHIRKGIGRLTVPQIFEELFGDSIKGSFLKFLKISEIVFLRDFLEEPEHLQRALLKIGLFQQLEEKFQQTTKQ